MHRPLLLLLLLLLLPPQLFTVAAGGVRAEPVPCPSSVTAGGALCDGKTDDTAALQAAINACAAARSPVVLPAGRTCLSQPLRLVSHSHIVLNAGAKLKAGAKWETGTPFMSCADATDVVVEGGGGGGGSTVDGSGQQWWTGSNTTPNRPQLIEFTNVTDVVFRSFTALNAAKFHISVSGARYDIANVTVLSPPYSIAPNTDGIDIGATNVTVRNCFVRNGDDSICMKGGAANVLVEDCVVEQGNGLVIGTSYNIDVHNITFRRCVANGTYYGAHVKAKGQQVGQVYDVLWEDTAVVGVRYGMAIDQYGQNPPAAHQVPLSSVVVRNITYRNLTAVGAIRHAGYFACRNKPGLQCTGIRTSGVDLTKAEHGCFIWPGTYGESVDTVPASCRMPQLP